MAGFVSRVTPCRPSSSERFFPSLVRLGLITFFFFPFPPPPRRLSYPHPAFTSTLPHYDSLVFPLPLFYRHVGPFTDWDQFPPPPFDRFPGPSSMPPPAQLFLFYFSPLGKAPVVPRIFSKNLWLCLCFPPFLRSSSPRLFSFWERTDFFFPIIDSLI